MTRSHLSNSIRPGAMVWLLGLTQIIGYGTLYYGFAILAPDIGAEFGWPVAWVYGALSFALLAGGIVAPFAGSRIDRHGAAKVMALGSVGSAAALAIVALAPSVSIFVVGLVAIELASAFVLYNAAFACLVQATGWDARRRITHLTLIAGFASTLFWPLTFALHAALSWREVFGVFAMLNLVVCYPSISGWRGTRELLWTTPHHRRPVRLSTRCPYHLR